MKTWAHDFAAAAGTAFLALLIGCLLNALRSQPLPWRYQNRAKVMDTAVAGLSNVEPTPQLAASPGEPAREIGLEDFQSFAMDHKGPVLDARPRTFYDLAHVPGALSLPRESFAETYPHLRGQLEASRDRPVAVYCSGADCTDSQLVADALAKLGYTRVLIYTSGWEEWSQTGLPQEETQAHP